MKTGMYDAFEKYFNRSEGNACTKMTNMKAFRERRWRRQIAWRAWQAGRRFEIKKQTNHDRKKS